VEGVAAGGTGEAMAAGVDDAGLVEAGRDFLEGWVNEMRIKQREGASCLYELKSGPKK